MALVMKSVFVGAVMSMLMLIFTFLPAAIAQTSHQAQNNDDLQDDGSSLDEEALADDITRKIDTTIKVLSVIKGEIEEAEKERLDDRVEDAAATTAMARDAARWISRINRAWREMIKATSGVDEASDDGESPQEEPDVIDSGAISGRLNTAIDMMTAIKRELEKEQKRQKGED